MIDAEDRQWGRFEEYLNEPGYRVKRLIVRPGTRMSLQKHHLRSEYLVVVAGEGMLILNNEVKRIAKGDTAFIAKEEVHRIENDGSEYLVIIETQLGICVEDDIVRLADDWGRK